MKKDKKPAKTISTKSASVDSSSEAPKRRGRPPKNPLNQEVKKESVSKKESSVKEDKEYKDWVNGVKDAHDDKVAEMKSFIVSEMESYINSATSKEEPEAQKEKVVSEKLPVKGQKKRGRKESTETVSKGVEKSIKKSTLPECSESLNTEIHPDTVKAGMLKFGDSSIPNFSLDFAERDVILADVPSVKVKRPTFD